MSTSLPALPWRAAAATSIGSFPGTEAIETARIVVGELPDLVHVAELPARGPGADMVGRTGGLLAGVAVGLSLETTPQGWRFASALGRDMRRARSFLGEDLDAMEGAVVDYAGPIKCQVVGPWTFTAAVEMRTGERALKDPVAAWDIAQALAEAVSGHVADIRRRVPRASAIVVQFDEPSLAAVLAGRIGTASGLSAYRAVDVQDAESVLRHVMDAAVRDGAVPGVHCCSPEIPIDLIRESGARFISLDMTMCATAGPLDEPLGQAWDSGLGLLVGCIPAVGGSSSDQGPSDVRASEPLRAILHRLGLTDQKWLDQIAVTPSCGMAGSSPEWVRSALAACRSVGRVVREGEEGRDET